MAGIIDAESFASGAFDCAVQGQATLASRLAAAAMFIASRSQPFSHPQLSQLKSRAHFFPAATCPLRLLLLWRCRASFRRRRAAALE